MPHAAFQITPAKDRTTTGEVIARNAAPWTSPATAVTIIETDRVTDDVACMLAAARSRDQVALDPAFLRAYFAAPPHGARPALLVARAGGAGVIGVSAFARFDVALDCLASRRVQQVAAGARAMWPRCLRTDVVMFGLPNGLGGFETVIAARDERTAGGIREAMIRRSVEICERERASVVIWKEMDAALADTWGEPLGAAGFARERSVPTVSQAVGFATLAEYEAALRANYRHQLRTNLKNAARAGLRVQTGQSLAQWAAAWYPLFGQVLDRSATRLETLRPEFFERLARDPRYEINTAVRNGELVGGAVCTVDRGTLHFLYVGMDYAAARDCDLYFNLLYSVLRLAVERGCSTIHWGQTSLDAKGRFGGAAEPLWFFLRFRRPALQRIIRSTGPLLFPERRQTARRVLRA